MNEFVIHVDPEMFGDDRQTVQQDIQKALNKALSDYLSAHNWHFKPQLPAHGGWLGMIVSPDVIPAKNFPISVQVRFQRPLK